MNRQNTVNFINAPVRNGISGSICMYRFKKCLERENKWFVTKKRLMALPFLYTEEQCFPHLCVLRQWLCKVQGQAVKHVYLSTFDIRRAVLRISSAQHKSPQASCSVPLSYILMNTLLLKLSISPATPLISGNILHWNAVSAAFWLN